MRIESCLHDARVYVNRDRRYDNERKAHLSTLSLSEIFEIQDPSKGKTTDDAEGGRDKT